jgi:hypothetical protein
VPRPFRQFLLPQRDKPAGSGLDDRTGELGNKPVCFVAKDSVFAAGIIASKEAAAGSAVFATSGKLGC